LSRNLDKNAFTAETAPFKQGKYMDRTVALLLILILIITSVTVVSKSAFSSTQVVENSWERKCPMQQARSGLGVVAVNGKIYAIGGSTTTGSYPYSGGVVGVNEEYNPSSNTWTYKTPMPTPMSEFGIAVYNNKIYCMSDDVNQVYDPATDTWENRTSMPTPRHRLGANVVDGKIYVIGGYDRSLPYGGDATDITEVYDPETDTWSTKAPMLAEKCDYASAVVGDKIYIIGGGSLSQPMTTESQIYDTKTDSWSYGAPFPYEYLSFRFLEGEKAAATTGVDAPERIYIFAEIHETGEQSEYSVQIYNPENDSWTVGADIPTHRIHFGVAVLDDLFYVIGGGTAYSPIPFDPNPTPTLTKYATNECYTPFGYGTIPPLVNLVSPVNQMYTVTNVSLNFTVNKEVAWMGYSIDCQDNVTVSGNTTLTEMVNGLHNLTVYAMDEFENIGSSATIFFSVELPQQNPFPTMLVAAASVAAVGVVGIGLFVYFKKRKR
jgi:N-acetylneuraminic acid mutarotase